MDTEQIDNSKFSASKSLVSRFTLRFFDFLASGFYSGRSPKAPGTAGTIVIMSLLWIAMQAFPQISFSSTSFVIFVVLLTAVGVAICNRLLAANFYGVNRKDPQQVVIDEFAGYLVTVIGAPGNITTLFLAFVLFRLFDITKPPPIRLLEKLPGGAGVVLDDVLAGVYACASLHLILHYL